MKEVNKKIETVERVYDGKERVEKVYTPTKSVYVGEDAVLYPSTNENLFDSKVISLVSGMIIVVLVICNLIIKKRKMLQ